MSLVLAQGLLAGVIMVAILTALFFEDLPFTRHRRSRSTSNTDA